MSAIRIIATCEGPEHHTQELQVDASMGMDYAREFAALLDGTSRFYVYPPGPGSVLGKCQICGARFKCEVKHADPR